MEEQRIPGHSPPDRAAQAEASAGGIQSDPSPAPKRGNGRTAVLVAGMHRSGTSAIAGLLNALGCEAPKTLMPANLANEAGYWESLEVVALNDAILASTGSGWDDWRAFDSSWYARPDVADFRRRAQAVLASEYGESRLFVLKDPRICRLMKFWLEEITRFGAHLRVVIPVRNPLDVAASLERRDGIAPALSHLLWLRHVLEAEAATRTFTRSFIRYDDVVASWQSAAQRLGESLDWPWPQPVGSASYTIDPFVSSSLRHHDAGDQLVFGNAELSRWIRTTFHILDRRCQGKSQDFDDAELDRIKAAFDEASLIFAPWTKTLQASIADLTASLVVRDTDLEAIRTRFGTDLAERDATITRLEALVAAHSAMITQQTSALTERDATLAARDAALTERDAMLAARDTALEKRDAVIAQRDKALADRDHAFRHAVSRLSALEAMLATAQADLERRQSEIHTQAETVAARDGELAAAAAREAAITAVLQGREAELLLQQERMATAEGTIAALRDTVRALHASTSWRITAPLRAIRRGLRSADGSTSDQARLPPARGVARLGYTRVGFPILSYVRAVTRWSRRPLRTWRAVRRISRSELFDRNWYLSAYPDVAALRVDPVVHYVAFGAGEGRDPGPMFSTWDYISRYPDVASTGINPLRHFLDFGAAEGRTTMPARPDSSHALPDCTGRPAADGTASTGAGHAAGFEDNAPRLLRTRPPDAAYRIVARGGPPAVGRSSRPLVICISHELPWPSRAGNQYRIAKILEWLTERGNDILLLAVPMVDSALDEAHVKQTAERCGNLVVCYANGLVETWLGTLDLPLADLNRKLVDEILRRYPGRAGASVVLHPYERSFCHDTLVGLAAHIARRFPSATYYVNYGFMTRVLDHLPSRGISFVDTHDIFSQKAKKVFEFGIRGELPVTEEEERRMLARADAMLAIQADDAKELRALVTGTPVLTVGVVFDCPEVGPPDPTPIALMVASENALNVKGLRDFLRFAWPEIKRRVPDATFLVVGSVGRSVQIDDPAVKIAGLVDSLTPYYERARVIVNPAVAGTGLKIKTVESVAHSRPIVTWPHGTDGIGSPLTSLCHVARDWPAFADAVVALLSDRTPPSAIADLRREIRRALGPETVYREFASWLDDAVGPTARVSNRDAVS